jgi:excinuclease UvrABC helicase subunit UvrB
VAEEIGTHQPTQEILTADELIKLAETQRAKVPWDVARLLMLSPAELEQTIAALERAMRRASADLEFEKAAVLRDQITELRKGMGEPFFAAAGGRRGTGTGRGSRGGPRGRYPRRR